MKYLTSTFVLATAAKLTAAHATVYAAWINNVDQGLGNSASGYIRSPPNNNPLLDVTSTDLTCNVNKNAVARTLEVKAGDKFTFEWHHNNRDASDDIIASSHHGPIMVYIAPTAAGTAGNSWVKIYEDGYNATTKAWAVDKLIADRGFHSIIIPNIAAGEYLLRPEIIALHEARDKYKAQFYMECVQIRVTSNGSPLPSGVAIPGIYSAEDPGILVDIYAGNFNSYKIPGPAVWNGAIPTSGGGGGSTSPTPTPTPTLTPSPPPTQCESQLYGQCDGVNWTGCKTCKSPYVCKYQNPYYSQCLEA